MTKIILFKKIIAKQKPWEPIIVSDNITWSEFSRLNLFLHELDGVKPVVSVAKCIQITLHSRVRLCISS